MVASPSDHPTTARVSNASSYSDVEDIFMTIEPTSSGSSDFFAIEPPNGLTKMNSLQKEKQISVDPISIKGSTIRQASFHLVSSPVAGTNPSAPSPQPPPKLKFVSASLPSSAASSPQAGSSLVKKIWNNQKEGFSPTLSRMRSAVDDTEVDLRGSHRRRSKSCGDGRASAAADDLGLLMEKQSGSREIQMNHSNKLSSSSKPPIIKDQRYKTIHKSHKGRHFASEDGFKCGKLCLFIPRSGKGKPVRSSSNTSSIMSNKTEGPAISRRVSMEKFDCGSWSSSIFNEELGEGTSLFFDLPLEMIRCSVSDMQSPVTAAFVFDKERDNMEEQPKGVLKDSSLKGSMNNRKSVRFSSSNSPVSSDPSSPTSISISPCLLKATREFTTLLEAHGT